jgi:hypothetical protein
VHWAADTPYQIGTISWDKSQFLNVNFSKSKAFQSLPMWFFQVTFQAQFFGAKINRFCFPCIRPIEHEKKNLASECPGGLIIPNIRWNNKRRGGRWARFMFFFIFNEEFQLWVMFWKSMFTMEKILIFDIIANNFSERKARFPTHLGSFLFPNFPRALKGHASVSPFQFQFELYRKFFCVM